MDAKHQIILPYNDPLVKNMLRELHERNMHCGPQTLLAASRERFWIIKGKIMARSIVQSCVRCTKARPQLYQQMMGNLPAERVTPSKPFLHTGVDYCGPVWVHYKVRGKKPQKCYIAVFCCFATKAVHLELVTELTTNAFIGALRRFLARRGRCDTIYSDNATNFIGARNQLAELTECVFAEKAQNQIVESCTQKGVNFKFIPPRAPHMGGLWEAAVKSAKHLLTRSVATASLTYEELETVIIEAEAILNSRPLTPLSTHPDDLAALTPGHFLVGEALIAQVDRQDTTICKSAVRWELVAQLKNNFWNQWSKEYLNELQQRRKWTTATPNIEEGTLVIIKEDNVPIMQWPLGRIVKVYKGDDNQVRVVDVKTKGGIMKRAIHRLAPLFPEHQQPGKRVSTESIQNEISKKKVRSSHPTIAMTMLIMMLLLPLALAKGVTIQRFGAQPGLYFEKMATTSLVSAKWKIISYSDFTPMRAELAAFSTGITAVNEACKAKGGISCASILTRLKQEQQELWREDVLLFGRHRSKRGAFDIVGNIAHSLFGVLDDNYAQSMTDTISKVKENEDYLLQLLRNQTSIIDTTINIVKHDEVTLQTRMNILQQAVKTMASQINNGIDESRWFNDFTSLTTQLTLTASSLRRYQQAALDVITDVHHGKANPMLLTPGQLRNELRLIRAHIPNQYTLPFEDTKLHQVYRALKAEGTLIGNQTIFTLTVPLTEHVAYDLFKITPIPVIKDSGPEVMRPEAEYLATSKHRDSYAYLTQRDIDECQQLEDERWLCTSGRALLGPATIEYSCIVQVLNKKSPNSCIVERVISPVGWIPLWHNNQWLYMTSKSTNLTTVCDGDTADITLNGTGILTVDSGCIVKNQMVTLTGYFAANNTIHNSYVRLTDATVRQKSVRKMNASIEVQNNEIQLDRLTALQERIFSRDDPHLPHGLQGPTLHNHIVSYSALTISIILFSLLVYTKMKKRQMCKISKTLQHELTTVATQPTPTQQNETTQAASSNFIVQQFDI